MELDGWILQRTPRVVQMASPCDCGPPPAFDVPPPPDPSLFMKWDSDSYTELERLAHECESDFPLPIDVVPKSVDPPLGEYLAFIISAIVVCVFVALTAIFVLLWFQRNNKNKLAGMSRPLKSASSSTGMSGFVADDFPAPPTRMNGGNRTQWSYNSMRPSEQGPLGVMMYGGSSEMGIDAPNFARTPQSTRTMPPTVSVPARLQQPNNLHTSDSEQIYCSAATPVQNNKHPNLYEEIRPPTRTVSVGSGGKGTLFEKISQSHARRRPPPNAKPPPPPCDSSCSCSGQSSPGSSVEHELENIQLTPSPTRRREQQPAHHKSTQSDDSFLDSSGNSPPEECCVDCNNGRESGYGTEGRPRMWDSPRGEKGRHPRHKHKQMWVISKERKNSGSGGALAVHSPSTMTYV